ncbi:hypothetical protein ACJMK2_007768 [Sinanodonta woodiana]|uniref:Uncharacterized protein n=1 Tax=Sinanodonta woodiana TaxID=1069815 RepID=A0ABD3VMR0_SINWO
MQNDKRDGESEKRTESKCIQGKERKRKRESYVPVENLGERAYKQRNKEVNESKETIFEKEDPSE